MVVKTDNMTQTRLLSSYSILSSGVKIGNIIGREGVSDYCASVCGEQREGSPSVTTSTRDKYLSLVFEPSHVPQLTCFWKSGLGNLTTLNLSLSLQLPSSEVIHWIACVLFSTKNAKVYSENENAYLRIFVIKLPEMYITQKTKYAISIKEIGQTKYQVHNLN